MSDCGTNSEHVTAEREPGVLYIHGYPNTDYDSLTAIDVDGVRFERVDDLVNLARQAWSIACCVMKGIGIPSEWGNSVRQGLRRHDIDPEKLYHAVSIDD